MTHPGSLATQGFHHITMVARNAARTVSFYRDLLGFPLVKQTVNFDDPSAWHLYFGKGEGDPGTLLTFFEWPQARRGQWGVGGVHHLALSVPDRDGLLKWKRRLADAGVAANGPIDRGYFTSLYFSDPDGQILEIATAGPGYAIDEPADALGQNLLVPPTTRLPEGRDEHAIARETWPEPVPEITPDMALTGIHHITAITDDLERQHEFFDEVLGLPLVKKTYNQDDVRTQHWFWARYDNGVVTPRSTWTLFGWPGATLQARPGAGQTHHVAFRARDDDEQAAWLDHLRAHDVEVTPVQDRNYFRSIYFRGPDGMLFEIATDRPGFAIDEPADALGQRLCLPSSLEPQRTQIAGQLSPLEPPPVAALDYELTVQGNVHRDAPIVVLLHGRGADRHDLGGVAPAFPEGTVIVTPQAPNPAAPWGYGPGWAWYRYLTEDRVLPETLADSLSQLHEFLQQLPELLAVRFGADAPTGPLVLGGFSQGGTTSLAYALTHPGTVDGVVVLSGFLVDAPDVVPVDGTALADTPVFWGHGQSDPAIPFSLGERGRSRLRDEGVDLTTHDYDMAHAITLDELRDLVAWMQHKGLSR